MLYTKEASAVQNLCFLLYFWLLLKEIRWSACLNFWLTKIESFENVMQFCCVLSFLMTKINRIYCVAKCRYPNYSQLYKSRSSMHCLSQIEQSTTMMTSNSVNRFKRLSQLQTMKMTQKEIQTDAWDAHWKRHRLNLVNWFIGSLFFFQDYECCFRWQ